MKIGGTLSCEEFGPRQLLVTADHIATPVGPDVDKHAESLQQYADAGVDELFVQQIGPDQDAFFTTWAGDILPRFR
jgi:hypothetical protein